MRGCPPVCPVNTGKKQEVILFSDLRVHKSKWQAIRITALFVEPGKQWEGSENITFDTELNRVGMIILDVLLLQVKALTLV